MKTFKEIYEETVKNNGCNAGEAFAKSMFEAGQSLGIDEYLKGITSWEDCLKLASISFNKNDKGRNRHERGRTGSIG